MDPAAKTPTGPSCIDACGLALWQSTNAFAGATIDDFVKLGPKNTHARSRPRGILLSVYPSVCVISQSACRTGSYVRQVMATLSHHITTHHIPGDRNSPFSAVNL